MTYYSSKSNFAAFGGSKFKVQSSKFKPLPGKWLLISHANK
jgi:hypothetical protein